MDEKTLEKARFLREAGAVKRCHALRGTFYYDVAQHVYGMLALLEALWPKAPRRLWRAVLVHDTHERVIGDIPASVEIIHPPAKKLFSELKRKVDADYGLSVDLSEHEQKWLKALDKLEFFLWCHDEINAGNDHVYKALVSATKWFEDNQSKLPRPVRNFLNNFEWRLS